MGEPIIQRSFAGGELAPALHARADQAKYQTGLRTCRNFLVRKEGGVDNRPGTRFVDACKTSDYGTRIFPYYADTPGESLLIEMGDGYFRFYLNGGPLEVTGVPAWDSATNYVEGDLAEDGGVNYYAHTANVNVQPPNAAFWSPLTGDRYELPSPYSLATLPAWNQSGNVITLTRHGYAPRELIFESLTRIILRTVTTVPGLTAPAGGAGTAGAAGTRTYQYVVTAAAEDTLEESLASGVIVVGLAAEPTPAAPNVITWDAVDGATEYYVYVDPFENGTFGYVGVTQDLTFRDSAGTGDLTQTPPQARVMFAAPGDYPARSAYHQQRRLFANTPTHPDAVYGSRTGFPSNFSISTPLQDDDAISFKIAGNSNHAVRWLTSLKVGLIVQTDAGEWTVTGGGPNVPLAPDAILPDQDGYTGIDPNVAPVPVGNAILYVQARGKIVRELRFDQAVEGLAGKDLSIFASHLFRGRTVIRLAYQLNPDSIIWAVRSDGTLLGLTYVPEQEVWGWHRHDTGAAGRFEDICVVPELNEDVLYCIVRRTINGATVRYLERLEDRDIVTFDDDCFFVDSGLTYSGAPANEISGLGHLEGQQVAIVADGTVQAQLTVTGGAILLPVDASVVHVGLPIQYAELETLDLDVQGTSVRDRKKRVNSVTVLLERSSRTFRGGPDSAHLRQHLLAPADPVTAEFTGAVEVSTTAEYGPYGRLLIRQVDPLPITILGLIPNVELGG